MLEELSTRLGIVVHLQAQRGEGTGYAHSASIIAHLEGAMS